MIFDDNILMSIEQFGQDGKPTALIARELGLTSSQLEDERKKNEALNNALIRADFNLKEMAKAKMYSDPMTAKNSGMWRELNIMLQEDNRAMDNEIIIREVE